MFNPIVAATRIVPALRQAHQKSPIKTAKEFVDFLDEYGAECIEADKQEQARIKKARENAEKAKKKATKKKAGRGRRR